MGWFYVSVGRSHGLDCGKEHSILFFVLGRVTYLRSRKATAEGTISCLTDFDMARSHWTYEMPGMHWTKVAFLWRLGGHKGWTFTISAVITPKNPFDPSASASPPPHPVNHPPAITDYPYYGIGHGPVLNAIEAFKQPNKPLGSYRLQSPGTWDRSTYVARLHDHRYAYRVCVNHSRNSIIG